MHLFHILCGHLVPSPTSTGGMPDIKLQPTAFPLLQFCINFSEVFSLGCDLTLQFPMPAIKLFPGIPSPRPHHQVYIVSMIRIHVPVHSRTRRGSRGHPGPPPAPHVRGQVHLSSLQSWLPSFPSPAAAPPVQAWDTAVSSLPGSHAL